MNIYDSFDDFWQARMAPTKEGIDPWIIAKFLHTSDEQYMQNQKTGKDTLGFQPTMLTLADPFSRKTEDIVIKNLSNTAVASLRAQYQQRFVDQLAGRFGLFAHNKNQADAVYDSWESFAHEWIEKDGRMLLAYNLPVQFDHVSDVAYWSWRQKGFDPCGTQRLIITLFQYRTGRFADVFITNTTDAEMSRIALLLKSKLTLQVDELF